MYSLLKLELFTLKTVLKEVKEEITLQLYVVGFEEEFGSRYINNLFNIGPSKNVSSIKSQKQIT